MTTPSPGRAPGRNLSLRDEAALRAETTRVLTQWPSAGVAVAVVRPGHPTWFHVRGLADAADLRPVDAETVFRIGSLTKVVTAVAVLQLWEEGRIDLDAPANDYLRAFQVTRADPRLHPCTVRHLLTHTSGIGYWRRLTDLLRPGPGAGVQAQRLVPLADVYRHGLPQEIEPGTKWVYSNHAFAALGQLVEDVSGLPLEAFFHDRILEPLGMRHTTLSPEEGRRSKYATGYVLRGNGLVPVPPNEVPTPGSGGLWSTAEDLARLVAFLLAPGASGVLAPSTIATMVEPQFQPDPRLPGMGLAFDLGREGAARTASKGGTVAGFHSMLSLAPDERVGVVVLTNTGGLDARGAATPLGTALLRILLGLPTEALRTDIAPHPETWAGLCGWYAPPPGRVTNLFARVLMGAGAEVVVEDRALVLKPMSPVPSLRRGMRLHPDDADDPLAFRVDLSAVGMGTMPVVFSGADAGRRRFFMDLMEFDRQPDALNPRRIVTGALVAGGGAAALHRFATRVGRR